MNSEYKIFRKSRGGAGWFATCGVFAAIILLGRSMGLLTEACLVVIAGYGFLCGVLPFLAGKRVLDGDVMQCVPEHEDLMAASSDQLELLLAQDDSNAGSVHVIAKTLARSKGRGTKESITDTILECYDEQWDSQVADLNDVAVYCQSLGIVGTMLGLADIAEVLEANAGNAGVGSAVATMVLTTLIGLAFFVLISGLARRLGRAVAKHRKDLKYVTAMFQREAAQTSRRTRSDNRFSKPGDA